MDIDLDELARQAAESRFPSAWDGCVMWAAGLISWHLAHHPDTWAPLRAQPGNTQTHIHQVNAVIASALHTTAIARQLDAPDGAGLLHIPLGQAADALLGDDALDNVTKASPTNPHLEPLLHSTPWPRHHRRRATRRHGQLVIEQARTVLTAHAEHGHTVGHRLRAVVEANYAVG